MREILLTSSLLILVLIALRYLLRGRIRPRVQYALWLLAAVRLLVPLSLPGTGLSVLNALPPEGPDTTVYVSSHGITTSAPAPETGTTADNQEVAIYYDDSGIRHFYPVGEAPPAGTDYTTVPAEQIFDLGAVLRTVWLCGAAVMAFWFLTVNLAFSARGSDVVMNMARGKVIYENGTFFTLDLEGIRARVEGYALPRIFS